MSHTILDASAQRAGQHSHNPADYEVSHPPLAHILQFPLGTALFPLNSTAVGEDWTGWQEPSLDMAASGCSPVLRQEDSMSGLPVPHYTDSILCITLFCSAINASIKGIHGLKPSSNSSLILLSFLMVAPAQLVDAVSTLDLGMVASLSPVGMSLVAITPMSAHEPFKPMYNCKNTAELCVIATRL